jgi:hypothetical protein
VAPVDSLEAEQLCQDPAALLALNCSQLSPTEEVFLCQVHVSLEFHLLKYIVFLKYNLMEQQPTSQHFPAILTEQFRCYSAGQIEYY